MGEVDFAIVSDKVIEIASSFTGKVWIERNIMQSTLQLMKMLCVNIMQTLFARRSQIAQI